MGMGMTRTPLLSRLNAPDDLPQESRSQVGKVERKAPSMHWATFLVLRPPLFVTAENLREDTPTSRASATRNYRIPIALLERPQRPKNGTCLASHYSPGG